MPVSFRSSHTSGDFSNGRLDFTITYSATPESGQRNVDVFFAVPRDFHTHNDSVAAALMTLVGRIHQSARFNFPISRRCAELLAHYYRLDDVGPVDESLEPRRPGRRMAMNFSGGIDSTLLWVLLHEYIGADVVVITSEYEHFRRERIGYQGYQRDVSCLTNLRARKLDQHGRFNFAVPLLFADYADIWSIAAGHTYDHAPKSLESLRDGRRPHFLDQDPALQAGGLTELHLMRPIFELNSAIGLVRAAPHRAEAALTACGSPGVRKHAMKSLALRYAFEREGQPIPGYLRVVTMPTVPSRLTGLAWRYLWMVKRLGLDVATAYDARVAQADLSFVNDMELTFLERYNTNFIGLVPTELRNGLLNAFQQVGIMPFNERDYLEMQTVREFLIEQGREIETPLPSVEILVTSGAHPA